MADERLYLRSLGKQTEAERAFQETLKVSRKSTRAASPLCAKKSPTTSILLPTNYMLLDIGLRKNKEALDWLEKACTEHTANVNAIKVDPIYDPLRSEPRFHAVLKQIHLE